MTVGELIKELEEFPEELPIDFQINWNDSIDIPDLCIDRGYLIINFGVTND